MFTIFTLILSTIAGMIAYRFAGNHIANKPQPVDGKTEFITKTIFSIVGGFIGLILAAVLYGVLKVIIPLIIIGGTIYLFFLYRDEIRRFFKTGRL
jgi:hypothetical protein